MGNSTKKKIDCTQVSNSWQKKANESRDQANKPKTMRNTAVMDN